MKTSPTITKTTTTMAQHSNQIEKIKQARLRNLLTVEVQTKFASLMNYTSKRGIFFARVCVCARLLSNSVFFQQFVEM